jgi:hypothetical protein
MRRRLVFPALLAAVLMSAVPARAAVITFDSVLTGSDPFTLDILVNDVTDLVGFNFTLSYDSTVLQLLSVTEGSFLASALTPGGFTFFIEGDTSVDGVVRDVAAAISPSPSLPDPLAPYGASGSGVLVSLIFLPLSLGDAGVTLDLASLTLLDSSFNVIPTEAVDGHVTVPEPSTLLLIGLGLAGAARWRRKANGREHA